MSVLIKGMDMPKNCRSCPFSAVGVDAYYCHCPTQDGKEYDFEFAETIPDGCPLVEVSTPHGDLIDKEELFRLADKRLFSNIHIEQVRYIAYNILSTVIESEE